jgi:hypothetical protein
MNAQTAPPLDPRTTHPYSQIIRRVDKSALPSGVIALYQPGDNILLVDAYYFDLESVSIRNLMLACTDRVMLSDIL